MGHTWTEALKDSAGMARRAGVVALALSATMSGASEKARAAPPRPPGAPLPTAAAATLRCTNGERSAIAELSCELGASFGSLGQDVVVAAIAPTADRALSRAGELGERIALATAHALGAGARVRPGPETPRDGRPAAEGASPVVFVRVEIAGGQIVAVADTRPAPRGFWERVRGASERRGAHASATRRLDGEIASFLPTVPLRTTGVDKASGSMPDVIALACGDVEGDAAPEIAVVGRRKIEIGRVRGARFVPHVETAWTTIDGVAGAPLREPIASAAISAGRFLSVGSTDRESGWLFSATLSPLRRLDGSVPWGRAGCLVRTGTAVGLPGPCARGDAAAGYVGDVPTTDAVAAGTAVDAAGKVRNVVAWRAPSDGAVTLRDDAGRTAKVASAGGALAIADLDLDGTPELVASENTFNPAEDALVVRSWREDGTLHERFRLPVPDGIRAIGACPPESAKMAAIVVATGSGLWVVR